jgi:AhpD family alkylhydroperoxidase
LAGEELIYIAVSVTNNCEYCIHTHAAAARAKGMTPQVFGVLLAVTAPEMLTGMLTTWPFIVVGIERDTAAPEGERPQLECRRRGMLRAIQPGCVLPQGMNRPFDAAVHG